MMRYSMCRILDHKCVGGLFVGWFALAVFKSYQSELVRNTRVTGKLQAEHLRFVWLEPLKKAVM